MKRGLIIVFAILLSISCGNNSNAKNSQITATENLQKTETATKNSVEVLYMHGKQRCVTCKAIGTEAETVVSELANDNVVIKTIDFSTAEGEKIADKYEIASSSLLVVKGDEVENVTAMSFKYAKNDPEQFRKNLKKTIEKMLK